MTNQLITHRLPIDYSLMSMMSSIRHVWLSSCYEFQIIVASLSGLRFPKPLKPKPIKHD